MCAAAPYFLLSLSYASRNTALKSPLAYSSAIRTKGGDLQRALLKESLDADELLELSCLLTESLRVLDFREDAFDFFFCFLTV